MGPLMMGCFKDEPKTCFFTGTWSVPDYLGNYVSAKFNWGRRISHPVSVINLEIGCYHLIAF
jgi:hypothetical protein